jgi:hypothetical protein
LYVCHVRLAQIRNGMDNVPVATGGRPTVDLLDGHGGVMQILGVATGLAAVVAVLLLPFGLFWLTGPGWRERPWRRVSFAVAAVAMTAVVSFFMGSHFY